MKQRKFLLKHSFFYFMGIYKFIKLFYPPPMRWSQKSKYTLRFGSPTTEAVGSEFHKTLVTNGFSRWSTNLYQVPN